MAKKVLVAGSGFAGVMAALGASRFRHERGLDAASMEIVVVSPEPEMVIRPRLYERDPASMVAPLGELFAATGIGHFAGSIEAIDADAQTVSVRGADGTATTHVYDRLVLATGSQGFAPPIPGLAEFGFSATVMAEAVALDEHLKALARMPESAARNTVVVGGAGFTGLEIATEMPARLREILGEDAAVRVIVVDRSAQLAPAMGGNPLSYIEQRMAALGIEIRLNVGIAQIDADGVTLADGERIETATVIWSGGMRASVLTAQLVDELDNLGRIAVEPDLRVPGRSAVFATGDVARAQTDGSGTIAPMSCQHARRLGAFAGHNAAADLLGEPTLAYDQPSYVTCLDLGPDDAIFTRGWDCRVEITGTQAKQVKKEINEVWIYPPSADRDAAYENVLAARTIDF